MTAALAAHGSDRAMSACAAVDVLPVTDAHGHTVRTSSSRRLFPRAKGMAWFWDAYLPSSEWAGGVRVPAGASDEQLDRSTAPSSSSRGRVLPTRASVPARLPRPPSRRHDRPLRRHHARLHMLNPLSNTRSRAPQSPDHLDLRDACTARDKGCTASPGVPRRDACQPYPPCVRGSTKFPL